MDHFLDSKLDLLPADGVGDVLDLDDLRGDVPGSAVRPYSGLDPFHQVLVQLHPSSYLHEQDHPHVVLPVLAHHQAVHDLIHGLHRAIYLGGPYPHPPRVQRRIGASVDDHPIVLRKFGIVTMVPHVRVHLEVCLPVLGPVLVVPEVDGHGRKGCRAYQLPLLSPDRILLLIKNIDLHTQPSGLQFPGPHRPDGVPQGKAGHDVRSPRD